MRICALLFLSVLCACGQLIGPRTAPGRASVQRTAISGRYNPAGRPFSNEGTPVDLLIIPSGVSGTLLTTGLVTAFTLGGGTYLYVDDRTPSHTFLTNAVYSRRTPLNFDGTLYSNNTHSMLWNSTTNLTPSGFNEGFMWLPSGIDLFWGVSATMTFKFKAWGDPDYNFDLLHLQSTNYAVSQLQNISGRHRFASHSEPGTDWALEGVLTNYVYNLHSRMNADKQRLEIALVDATNGTLLGTSSKNVTVANGGYGTLTYLKLQDYLWSGTEHAQIEMSMIALDWSHKAFPLEPITVPTPASLYLVQVDTNKMRLIWNGIGVNAKVERNTNSTGWLTVTNEHRVPAVYYQFKEFTDTNVVNGVVYAYRITEQVGDYSSTAATSVDFTITNTYAGFDVLWQQCTNEFQSTPVNTGIIPTGSPYMEQQVKGINTAAVKISKVSLNIETITEGTSTNGETLQVSVYSKTNRGGVFYGISRGTVLSTNTGWRDFVFHTPITLPAGSNFVMNVEGNNILANFWTTYDEVGGGGYLPGEGFNIWYYVAGQGFTNTLSGSTNDLNFKVYIKYTPLPVSNVTTNQVSDTAVTITWPDSNQGLVRYKVDQFHGSWTDDATNTTATNVTITGLTIGETYKWRVYSYIPGQSGSESAKVESQLITMADLPIVTNTFVTMVSGGSAVSRGSGERGEKFTVGASAIVITRLGFYATAGTYSNTVVKLRDASCNVLASSMVLGVTAGSFNWGTNLAASISLTPGATYSMTRDVAGFNEVYGNGPVLTTTSVATLAASGVNETCATEGFYEGICNYQYYEP